MANNIHIKTDDPAYTQEVHQFLQEWKNDNAYIHAYTSGSTGKPKKITLSKDKMRASARATGEFFHFAADQWMCNPLSVRYIAGKMMVVRALEWNMNLDLLFPSTKLMDELTKVYDFMVMTPHQLSVNLQAEDAQNLRNIRKLLLGGSPPTPQLIEEIQQLHTEIYIGYGMTETMSHVAVRRLNGPLAADHYTAVPHVDFTHDERNCLIIHAKNLLNEPLLTNDVVKLHSPASFTWLGRADHAINTGGIKVFPETIENKIQGLVSEPFYISHISHEILGEQVVIVLESETLSEEKQQQLLNSLRDFLTPYERPQKILFHEKFEYTETGKLIRR